MRLRATARAALCARSAATRVRSHPSRCSRSKATSTIAVLSPFKGVLQSLKARHAARVVDDSFAVDERRAARQCPRRCRDARETVGPVVAAPRQHRGIAVVDAAQHAIAVELRLEQPARAVGRARHGRSELRRRLPRQRAAPSAADAGWRPALRVCGGRARAVLRRGGRSIMALQQQPIVLAGLALAALGHAHEREAAR